MVPQTKNDLAHSSKLRIACEATAFWLGDDRRTTIPWDAEGNCVKNVGQMPPPEDAGPHGTYIPGVIPQNNKIIISYEFTMMTDALVGVSSRNFSLARSSQLTARPSSRR